MRKSNWIISPILRMKMNPKYETNTQQIIKCILGGSQIFQPPFRAKSLKFLPKQLIVGYHYGYNTSCVLRVLEQHTKTFFLPEPPGTVGCWCWYPQKKLFWTCLSLSVFSMWNFGWIKSLLDPFQTFLVGAEKVWRCFSFVFFGCPLDIADSFF